MRNGETAPNFAPEHLIAAGRWAVEFLPQAFNALISVSRFAVFRTRTGVTDLSCHSSGQHAAGAAFGMFRATGAALEAYLGILRRV
jgi:hypothetical protein